MTMARNQSRKPKGYSKFAAASEAGGKKISADALLVTAIVLSATLLLVTFLAPAGKKILSPDQGIGTFPKRGHGN